MSEIPEDVMKAATYVATALLYPDVDDDGRAYLTQDHINIIARAILAERERCVGVAREVQSKSDDFNGAYDGLQDFINRINNA